jgi:DNA-binding response OmpR family regulator
MSRILIIEDEKEMALGLKDNLEYEGHVVSISDNGHTGLLMAKENPPDLIILDIMLPRKSGFDVCKELRADKIGTPVIMLTARGEEADKVLGLELGADDYITKPFSVREFLARVKAVLRRYESRHENADDFYRIGRIWVDFKHYRAKDEQGDIELTHKEFEILKYFIKHDGQSISRDQLIEKVWGYEAYPTTRTVDNHIVKLRKKIEQDPAHPKHILTVHGIGYKFVE